MTFEQVKGMLKGAIMLIRLHTSKEIILDDILEYMNKLKDAIGESKVKFALESRSSVLFLIIHVENPSTDINMIIDKARGVIAEMQKKHGELFKNFQVEIDVEKGRRRLLLSAPPIGGK